MSLVFAAFASTTWPAALADCELFLEDGKSFVADGCDVWANLAPTAPSVTQTTGSLRPDLDSDRFGTGDDGVLADGVDDRMEVSSMPLMSDFSIYMVLFRNRINTEDGITWGSSNTTDLLFTNQNFLRFWDGVSTSVRLTANNAFLAGPYLVDVHRSSGAFTVFRDGVDVTDVSSPSDTTSLHISRLFSTPAWSSAVSIGAFAAYSRTLTGSERTSVRSYFSTRWR